MHNNRSRTVRYNKTLITAPPPKKRQTCKIKTSLTTFHETWQINIMYCSSESVLKASLLRSLILYFCSYCFTDPLRLTSLWWFPHCWSDCYNWWTSTRYSLSLNAYLIYCMKLMRHCSVVYMLTSGNCIHQLLPPTKVIPKNLRSSLSL